MKDIRLICCDLDGTLLCSDKSLSEENIRWINRVREEKMIPFAFATGRPNIAVRRYFRALGFSDYSICLNGCMLWSGDCFRPLFSHLMSPRVLSAIVRVQKLTGIEMLMLNGNTWFTERQDGYLYDSKFPIYARKSVLCHFEEVPEVNKVIFMSRDPDELERLASTVLAEVGDPSLITLYPGRDFLEIMPGGISKGTGLDELASLCRTDISSIMVIGDDVNDIDMFRRAGFSVAMGNACDEVKSFADYVTDDNDHDGVARAIEHVFYGGSL